MAQLVVGRLVLGVGVGFATQVGLKRRTRSHHLVGTGASDAILRQDVCCSAAAAVLLVVLCLVLGVGVGFATDSVGITRYCCICRIPAAVTALLLCHNVAALHRLLPLVPLLLLLLLLLATPLCLLMNATLHPAAAAAAGMRASLKIFGTQHLTCRYPKTLTTF
jgi:hypothetical protein